MTKKQIIPIHPKPPLHWLILKRRFTLLAPVPYAYVIPDLKLFKK